MFRCRPLLGRVPRAGSPTSSLVPRHSDFSRPRRRSTSRFAPPFRLAPETPRSRQFLGNPSCACAGLRPRWRSVQVRTPGLTPCVLTCSLLPSASFTASASTWLRLSGLHVAAHAPAVYASQPPSRADHARLASGWRSSTLAGWESHPRVALKVSHRYMTIPFLQAWLVARTKPLRGSCRPAVTFRCA